MTPNLAAFLNTAAHSEGTDRATDPYRVCFGFKHYIVSLDDHPAVTGEWLGESLAFLGEQYAHSISTAAGRYQIIKGTWLSLKLRLRLPDFTGPSQDDAAIELIKEAGALELVNAGNAQAAIEKCSSIWASFPGSQSGQPQRTMAALLEVFTETGGELA